MELMTRGAMMTVLSTLFAALAWPAALLSATDLIDSKWAIALDRFVLSLDSRRKRLKGKRERNFPLCLSLISSILEWDWC